MKIAMIGHKTVPSRVGGIEVAVEELSIRLEKRGCQVELYNRWEVGTPKGAREYQGIRMYNIPTSGKISLNAPVYSILATVRALLGRYDVIHIHAEGPAAMTWLPKLLGIPVVVTIHGLDWKRSKWGRLARTYLRIGERMAARWADAIIVLSADTQKYFEELYGRKTYFIRNGVTPGIRRDAEEITKRWGIEKDEYVLYLSRLTPEKGLHYLLEAFRRVNTNKRLVIAGRMNHTSYVQDVIREAAKDSRVLMVDFVEGKVLEELFSNCCVYVLPSDIEGMAISLLEALSYGVPCLVSDIQENQKIADSYVRYFKKADAGDLAEKLQKELAEPMPAAQRDAQIAFMREHFGWERVTDQTLLLYKKTASRKGKKRWQKKS